MASSRNTQLVQSYSELRLLIFSITHSFSARFNIPFDDLISESHLCFVKAVDNYDKRKGSKLSSWVYHEVWTGLMSFMRKELRHRGLDEFTEFTPTDHTKQNNFLLELQSELGRDAKSIVNVLLGGGRDFTALCRWNRALSKTAILESLKEHLQDKGMPSDKVEQGINDLKAVTNSRSRTASETEERQFEDWMNERRWSSHEECWLLDKIGLTPARVQTLLCSS